MRIQWDTRMLAQNDVKRRPTNVSLREDLVAAARDLDLNISRIAEEALDSAVRNAAAQRWLEENRAAVEDYNARVERRGLFNDGLRRL